MQIELNSQINMNEILDSIDMNIYSFISCSIGNDSNIYVLYKSEQYYKAIVLFVNWEEYSLLDYKILDIGITSVNIYFLQPLEDCYLLVAPRASYFSKDNYEQNALIFDESMNIVQTMCLGDGIEDCLVDSENNIIISYFDEGIIGNLGWGCGYSEPLGSNGIVKWSKTGTKLWEAKEHFISECYAMNIDVLNNLWFYYYSDFNLVKTNYHDETVYYPNLSGSSTLIIHKYGNKIIFDKDYNNHETFVVKQIEKEQLSKNEENCVFIYEDTEISSIVATRSSKIVFLDNDNMLYYVDWITV